MCVFVEIIIITIITEENTGYKGLFYLTAYKLIVAKHKRDDTKQEKSNFICMMIHYLNYLVSISDENDFLTLSVPKNNFVNISRNQASPLVHE